MGLNEEKLKLIMIFWKKTKNFFLFWQFFSWSQIWRLPVEGASYSDFARRLLEGYPMTSSKDEITASKNPNDHGQRQNWDFDISEKVFLAAKCPPLRRAGDAKQLVINLFRWVRMQRLYLRWWSRKTSTLDSRLFRFLVLSKIWDWIWMKNALVSARHK